MNIWEKTFSQREWGKYPPEILVSSATKFRRTISSEISPSCLELGCGPGANLTLLYSLFDHYCAIDISPTAIAKVNQILGNKVFSEHLVVGDFTKLPWPSCKFDFICDNLSIYANHSADIKKILAEVYRVLKPSGLFYSRVWGKNTYGISTGLSLSDISFDDLKDGPCEGYGISSFFSVDDIRFYYDRFDIVDIIRLTQESSACLNNSIKFSGDIIEEYVILATK